MEHPRTVELVRLAVAAARGTEPLSCGVAGVVPVARYTDEKQLELEREKLFRKLPVPLLASAELREPGATAVRELGGVSLILMRGDDGVARGFKNACRHRGTRVVREDCQRKALVCPYHGWTYGLDGALRHVPHLETFPKLDCAQSGLVQIHVEERHGFVWASLAQEAPAVRAHLGEVDDELAAMSFATHALGRRVVSEQSGNWKMLMEAFLEGYHIRTLHRKTIYPFFLDGKAAAQQAGLHIRHASARRAAVEAGDSLSPREQATVGYVIFPCTVLIAHPDWTSHVVVQPLATDRFLWSHTQLIPVAPTTDEARAHFQRSFELIEENVFQKEDLFAIAEMQAGLRTGANHVLTFGELEAPALWFHDVLRTALQD